MNLESLSLPERTTDAGFEHLQKLVKLRHLWPLGRERNRITDRGLAYLRNMTELEELDLTRGRSPTRECGTCSG